MIIMMCEHSFVDVTEERRAALGPVKPWFQKLVDEKPKRNKATLSLLRQGRTLILKCIGCGLVRFKDIEENQGED